MTFPRCTRSWPRTTCRFALALTVSSWFPAAAAEKVWDGSGRSDAWSEGANWTPLGDPIPGDDLRFPPGAQTPSNQNDFPADTLFNRLTYSGAGYTTSGNAISLSGGILVSHGAGSTIINVPISLENGQTFNVVEAGATLFLNGALSLGRTRDTLTFDGAGQAVVVGNIVGATFFGSSSVRKRGPGTLWIFQHPTYTGPTLVEGGVLRVDGSVSNSTVVLEAGTTLRGLGKVGGLVANAGSTVSPGATSPDRMNVLGDLTLANGSSLTIRLNGTNVSLNYDQLDVQGTVTLGGSLVVTMGYAPDIGDTFTLINNDGTEPVAGTFSGLPEGTKFLVGTRECTISYRGGTGNDVVLRHGLPLWSFSVLAAVSEETAAHYSGLAAIGSLITNQITIVNARFNDPKVFDGHFRFVVTTVKQFSGSADSEISKAHPDHDFKVVYDGFPAHGGGWFGDDRTIYHSWGVNNAGGPFGPSATDGLVHEFGHSRGAIDLYALNVTAGSSNAINGEGFEAVNSIMNYPYNNTVWDEHSQHLINRNATTVAPPISYITGAFPPSIRVRVRETDSTPFPNVAIKLFPVPWFSRSVTNVAAFSGQTDNQGVFVPSSNPFGPNTPGSPWDLRYPNFLVSARFGHNVAYAWMALYEVQNSYFNAPSLAFVLTLTLGVDTFDAWRLVHFSLVELSNPALSGPLADPDNDNLSNLMEYALALDPHHANPGPVLSYTLQNANFFASYTRRKLTTTLDLSFVHQTSAALGAGWTEASIAQLLNQGLTERINFTDVLPTSQTPGAFFRLRVIHRP